MTSEGNIRQEDIGRAIQEVRAKRGLTQSQLSERTGLTVNYISLLENGKRGISLEKLNNVADTLQYPASFLLVLYARRVDGFFKESVETCRAIAAGYLETIDKY